MFFEITKIGIFDDGKQKPVSEMEIWPGFKKTVCNRTH
jgi:hypothetical protein